MIDNMGALIAEMHRMQQELKNKTVEIEEGNGAFRIIINGHQEVQEVKFAPAALSPEHIDELQIVVARAVNKALAESKQMIKEEVAKMTGGMGLPNIPGLF